MKKLSALILSLIVMSGAVVASYAAKAPPREVPNDHQGNAIGHPLYGGYAWSRKATAAEAVICSGKCLLAGVILNTGAPTTTLTLRDTGTADGGGTVALIHRYVAVNTEPGNNPVRLPMLFSNGISAELSSISSNEAVVVLYLDLD